MFQKILIANRGEIVLRIARTCRRMGIRTVAVYSEADARALHVKSADEAVFLGGSPARESYLDMDKVLAAALATGAQAIHPGYGFLSENPAFAARVRAAGLTWIGPGPEAIALLGDKIAAKALAIQSGIPVVPGLDRPLQDLDEIRREARRIGFPVLLKPAAGGGGKGMRIAHREADLEEALATSTREALRAFADGRVFLERYIAEPRHVEIQVMADHHGHAIHLGERECSIQRRYQKVLEEAPSTAVGEVQRKRMGRMACELALKAGYANAGTVEFIFDPNGDFYFLEMNSRLQVEHPVTEAVTGLDLVELQLRIAAGEPLPLTQDEVTVTGWAMEARICAEDPSRDFIPSTGMITRYAMPARPGIRVDSGVVAGSVVPMFYDSLLAKVISRAPTRAQAIEQLIQALNSCHIEGPATNVDFVNAILDHPRFQKGDISTGFIDTWTENGRVKGRPRPEHLECMAMAATLVFHSRQSIIRDSLKALASNVGLGCASRSPCHYVVKGEEDVFEVSLASGPGPLQWDMNVNGRAHRVTTPEPEFYRRRLRLQVDEDVHHLRLEYRGSFIWVAFRGTARVFEVYSPREWALAVHMPSPRSRESENLLRCPMPGLVVKVLARKGDRVYKGQDLVAIESMKMESHIPSPADGEVESVHVEPGQAVETDQVLVTFKGWPGKG